MRSSAQPRTSPKIGFVSLGCPKALVDSERILTQLRIEGYAIVPTYENSDLVIVNTCGFINAAVEESLEAIGEALAENGKVIVTGCLGVKEDRIRQHHPAVLAVTGPQRYEEVMSAVHAHLPPRHDPFVDLAPPQGIKLTPRHYAYLKISEGCDHRCTFCIIPSLRGNLVSRPVGEVLREAERLVAAGVKELLVIAQDTSAYGVDIQYRSDTWRSRDRQTRLIDLAEALAQLGVWIRLHYIYPYPHVDKLLPLMAEGNILPYLDVPFQHASPRILKRMKRPAAAEDNLERIRQWRDLCPDLAIRSTFIVGFPGESEEDFELLMQFIKAARLDRVGCFKYSAIEGASANALPGLVPEEVKEERYHHLMEAQAQISRERLREKIGKRMRVLVDEVDSAVAVARSPADAPEIDGQVFIEAATRLRPGEFAEVVVTGSDDYDLQARLVPATP